MPAVRFLATILVALGMLSGQVHFCPGVWIAPSGELCLKCPTNGTGQGSETISILTGFNDCRSCCTYDACGDRGGPSAIGSSFGHQIDYARAKASRVALPYAPRLLNTEHRTERPPNAPSVSHRSRPPPSHIA